jgi:hypothetical protein
METTQPFSLTPRQFEANQLLGGPAKHILLRGGSRSGKTFLLVRATTVRALKKRETTHAIMRFRFNHLKGSIIYDTLPRVVSLCFPGLSYTLNKTDWFAEFPNRSRIWFGGLDDKERTEKVLGQEHSTIYLNECSQISYDARNKMVTRLAQNKGLRLKAYYDANPPSVGHWTYRMFEKKIEPKSGALLADPDNYASLRINPDDNTANLPPDYVIDLAALPEREKRRFLHGEYLSQVDGALWTWDSLDQGRIAAAQLPPLRRIVVAVDPSGCRGPEDTRSDEIGIVAAGNDDLGNCYVLEDASGRYSPDGWAGVALALYDRWQADTIIGERNYGGAMVEHTLRTARANAPFKEVVASRGKAVRAEPIAALYEQGKVFHVGAHPDLEEQLCNFSRAGYQGPTSPDRADAAIWALTDLAVSPAPVFAFGSV